MRRARLVIGAEFRLGRSQVRLDPAVQRETGDRGVVLDERPGGEVRGHRVSPVRLAPL